MRRDIRKPIPACMTKYSYTTSGAESGGFQGLERSRLATFGMIGRRIDQGALDSVMA